MQVLVQNSAATWTLNLVNWNSTGNELGRWDGWMVLDPTDNLIVHINPPPMEVTAAGSLLRLTGAEAPTA
jgi:hypothetical protein